MERRADVQETEPGRTLEQDADGRVIQFMSAREQFSTRSCARCAGLLVREWRHDGPDDRSEVLRCVQCGHRIDPVILINQCRPADESHRAQRPRQRQPLRTAALA